MGRFFRNNTKHWNEILRLCVQLCAYGLYTCLWVYVEGHRSNSDAYLKSCFPSSFEATSLSGWLGWSSWIGGGWLARAKQVACLSPFFIAGIASMRHHTWALHGCWGSNSYPHAFMTSMWSTINPPISLSPKKLYCKENFAELLGCDDCYLH